MKIQSVPPKYVDSVQVLKDFLSEMKREGRFAYIDERNQREFRLVDGQLVEVTTSNRHLFPEAAVGVSIKETIADDAHHDR